jgi:hypothetical protein
MNLRRFITGLAGAHIHEKPEEKGWVEILQAIGGNCSGCQIPKPMTYDH